MTWTKCFDKLPPLGKPVLVVWKGHVQHATYQRIDWHNWECCQNEDADTVPTYDFSHWMPLPDPPKDEP